MSLVQFIAEHGYWALFIGAFLEGEIVLLAAGFLAHRGRLQFPLALAVALAGTFAADQCFFLLGRVVGSRLRRSRPLLADRAEATAQRIRRRPWRVIFGFRFLYGARVVVPFLIGAGRFSIRRFLSIDAVAAVAWTAVVSCAGYILGEAAASLLPTLQRYELGVLCAVFVLVVGLKFAWRLRRHAAQSDAGHRGDGRAGDRNTFRAPDSDAISTRSRKALR